MKNKLYTILISAICFVSMAIGCLAQETGATKEPLRLSFETLGAIRYENITKGERYGAGIDAAYEFNQYVLGHLRVISYSGPDKWRGTTVDEGSALVEARLLSSQNARVSLSAIGGVDRDFEKEDWGFSAGVRGSLWAWKGLSLVAEARIRAWMDQDKDLSVVGGLQYKF